jgi:outer membrane biogenesis lipoprotein LolB
MAKIKVCRTPKQKTVLFVIFALALLSAGSVSASILPIDSNITKKIQGSVTQPVSNVISELEQYYTQIKQTYLSGMALK